MKLLNRESRTLPDRLAWQCASLLLTYPDDDHLDRLRTVDQLLTHLSGPVADLLARTAAALRALDPMAAAATYVDTFDLRRKTTLYLTYWTAGDTRNRGDHMLAFTRAYREAGVNPPREEMPDFLPLLLEFAATVDAAAGRRLLIEHRVAIDVLRAALREAGSAYSHAVAAVCQTLPAATDQELRRAHRLALVGPSTEAVGLQPFTLTVPPRRDTGGA